MNAYRLLSAATFATGVGRPRSSTAPTRGQRGIAAEAEPVHDGRGVHLLRRKRLRELEAIAKASCAVAFSDLVSVLLLLSAHLQGLHQDLASALAPPISSTNAAQSSSSRSRWPHTSTTANAEASRRSGNAPRRSRTSSRRSASRPGVDSGSGHGGGGAGGSEPEAAWGARARRVAPRGASSCPEEDARRRGRPGRRRHDAARTLHHRRGRPRVRHATRAIRAIRAIRDARGVGSGREDHNERARRDARVFKKAKRARQIREVIDLVFAHSQVEPGSNFPLPFEFPHRNRPIPVPIPVSPSPSTLPRVQYPPPPPARSNTLRPAPAFIVPHREKQSSVASGAVKESPKTPRPAGGGPPDAHPHPVPRPPIIPLYPLRRALTPPHVLDCMVDEEHRDTQRHREPGDGADEEIPKRHRREREEVVMAGARKNTASA